jgi:hypothetical protein
MNLHNEKPKLRSEVRNTLKGIFSDPIPYVIRNTTGNWSNWFGNYEGQRYFGKDMNTCWSHAGNENAEDQLEWLWAHNQFSADDIKWFHDKGYIDEDGDFFLSRRFVPTLSGVRDGGNDEAEFWRLTCKYGAIPYKLLSYNDPTKDFFDKSAITPAMFELGKEFLKRVNIKYEELGRRFSRRAPEQIKAALFQAPLQIGIPIPALTFLWNQERIDWDGSMEAAHSVELYGMNEKGEYLIFDQYEPHLKILSADYFIPIITRAVVTANLPIAPNPVSQKSLGAQIWRAIQQFFIDNPLWHE